jgi:alkylation response protein AidB-like acyl-CoA dehydrogenase
MSSALDETAHALAGSLAEDAVKRDRAAPGADPEVEKLRRSGLLSATAPPSLGGDGMTFGQAFRALRLIAAQDNSTAMLLGYHWVVVRTALAQGGFDAALDRATRSDHYLAGVTNARGTDLTWTADGDGYRLDGRRTFCTGARVADLLFVTGEAGGKPASLIIPADRTGVVAAADWDSFGERGSESGSVTFNAVRVERDELTTGEEPSTPTRTLSAPLIQLLFVNLYLGGAQGALADAVEYIRTSARPWARSTAARAQDDPYVIAAVGTMHAEIESVRVLADDAGRRMDDALAAGPELTAEQRGQVAVTVYAAKLQASRVGLEITSRVFEVMGARAAVGNHGYDRRWRDLRVHTLHDPVAYKAQEVGAYVLSGVLPEPTNYS